MEFYNKYTFSNSKYDDSHNKIPLGWDNANNRDKVAEYWAYDFEYKFEYGLADWFNFIGSIGYENATYKEYDRPANWGPYTVKSHGIKAVSFGAKIRAIENPMVVSYQFLCSLPGSGQQMDEPLIGKDDARFELRMLLGKSYKIFEIPAYSGLESGYRWRTANVSDDIPIFFETGIALTDWIMITGELDNWIALNLGGKDYEESIGTVRGGLIYSPTGKFNQFKRDPGFFNIAVQGGYVYWGRNTNAGWEVVVKASTCFDMLQFVDNIDPKKHPNTRQIK
jgi:hypothetical protein